MATYTFNKTQLEKFRKSLYLSTEGSKVWFIPHHHGGCLQVLREDDTYDNIFCSRRTGHSKLCDDTVLIQTALELKDKHKMMLHRAKKSAKFSVKLLKATKQIQHILYTR